MPQVLAAELDLSWENVGARAGQVALVLLLAWASLRVARRAIPRAVARLSDSGGDAARSAARTTTLSALLLSVATAIVYALAGITVLGQVGIALGPLIAGAGVVGLAIGFGAQQLVRDVISGFFVLVEDQYAVGDVVTAGGVSGTVEGLTLRLTKLRGDDGVLHHVRNGDLGVVSNASRGYAVASISVPVPADVDVVEATARVRQAMAALVDRGDIDEELLADPLVLGVTDVRPDTGAALLGVTARTTPRGRSAVQRALLRETRAALRAEPPRRARRTTKS